MWKFVLTLGLALLTVSNVVLAGDRSGRHPGGAPGWLQAENRGWQRDEGQGWNRGGGRDASGARRPSGNGGSRQDRRLQRAQDDYRPPFSRPPDRDRRNDPRQRNDRGRQNDRRQQFDRGRERYNPDQGGRNRARDAYRRGRIRSLDEVMSVVQRRYRGRVLNVRLDDQRLIYHLRVLTRQGRVLRIAVDARNARILSVTGGGRR